MCSCPMWPRPMMPTPSCDLGAKSSSTSVLLAIPNTISGSWVDQLFIIKWRQLEVLFTPSLFTRSTPDQPVSQLNEPQGTLAYPRQGRGEHIRRSYCVVLEGIELRGRRV